MIYRENDLNAHDFNRLRQANGWPPLPDKQISHALNDSFYIVSAEDKGCITGMGRVIGDGAILWYIQDLLVLPSYQESSVSSTLLEMLLEFVQSYSLPETTVSICLMSAGNQEDLYKNYGFKRLNEHSMLKYLTK